MPVDAIRSVETFTISIPRDVPYLGPLRPGESVNPKGYIVRTGNRTIYPSTDMSVIVKVTGESGKVGWGETYGIVAPKAVGPNVDLMVDLHWKFTAGAAIALIRRLEPYRLYFAEAPCAWPSKSSGAQGASAK